MPMRLTVNGEVREAPDSATLGELLALMGIETGRVAVERNREIAPRSHWSEIALVDGDRLEIVHFVGGG
jgi:thiamine biosynthesis protein ThiS